VLFVAEKNGGKIRNEGGRDEGCSLGHKLNITDRLIDGFKSVGNFICKIEFSQKELIYFPTEIVFAFFFHSLFSYYNSLLVHTKRIFPSVFTDGYNK